MIVVSNRICVEKGQGLLRAPRFTQSQALCGFHGFVKVEVLVSEQDDHDEMSVNMYWHSMADFQVWRDSDAFKAAHKRPENADTAEKSPAISSRLVVATVAASLECPQSLA